MEGLVKLTYVVVGKQGAWPHSDDLAFEWTVVVLAGVPSSWFQFFRIPRPWRRLIDRAVRDGAISIVKTVVLTFSQATVNFLLCGHVVVMLERCPDPLLPCDRLMTDVKSDQSKLDLLTRFEPIGPVEKPVDHMELWLQLRIVRIIRIKVDARFEYPPRCLYHDGAKSFLRMLLLATVASVWKVDFFREVLLAQAAV